MFSTHKARGRFKYSPKKPGQYISNKWWLVLDCDSSIGDYYRQLTFKGLYNTQHINRPLWGCHVTVIRNEEPPLDKQHLWHKYDDRELEFEYTDEICTDGLFFWLQVCCPELYNIRTELGLPRNPKYDFHLTFGNTKNGIV